MKVHFDKVVICVGAYMLVFGVQGFAEEGAIQQATPPPGMRGDVASKQMPDISAIGMFSGRVSTDPSDTFRNKLLVDSFEVAFQGYVYPNIYMSFYPSLHFHEGTLAAELCEGYADFQNIGAGFGLQVGKIHADVGKVNREHAHKRFEFDQPAVITAFFGEHGLIGQGLTVRYLAPWSLFTELKLSAYYLPTEEHDHGAGEEHAGFSLARGAAIAKLHFSGEIAESSELELGFSGIVSKGSHIEHHEDDVIVAGVDLTFRKWLSGYQRLILRNELFALNHKVPVGIRNRLGFYNHVEYRFDKYLTGAVRYDWAEEVMTGDATHSVSPIVGWNFTESTRLLGQYTYFITNPDNEHRVALQLVIGLGPHSHTME